MRVNKAELAQILGCSLPTISAYIVRYGDAFPVLERGGRGRDWWFDHEAVTALPDARREAEVRADTDRQVALRQLGLPLGRNGGPSIDIATPLRPADMLALMKVRKLQRDEAYECGRLVEANKVKAALKDLLGAWNRDLRRTLRRFGRERDLPGERIADLDAALSACQRDFVRHMQTGYEERAAQPSLFTSAAE